MAFQQPTKDYRSQQTNSNRPAPRGDTEVPWCPTSGFIGKDRGDYYGQHYPAPRPAHVLVLKRRPCGTVYYASKVRCPTCGRRLQPRAYDIEPYSSSGEFNPYLPQHKIRALVVKKAKAHKTRSRQKKYR